MEAHQSRQLAVEDADFYPASPTSEFIHSSVLSLTILAVFELEIPIDDSEILTVVENEFLPTNPRFSSLLLTDEKGKQQWKRVEVTLQDHVKVPHFPVGLQPEAYDWYFKDYLSKIFMERLPEDRPLWEIHVFEYPTSRAAGTVMFKLHHALGDGFSLMGALFSCLKRADDPSLPLTFPASAAKKYESRGSGVVGLWRGVGRTVTGCWNTSCDFCSGVLRSTVLVDDRSAIRPGTPVVEKEPVSISTVKLSLDDIRQVKYKIGGSLVLTMVSYHGNLRLSVAGEKGFIDSELFTSCVKEAFDKIYIEACGEDWMKSCSN